MYSYIYLFNCTLISNQADNNMLFISNSFLFIINCSFSDNLNNFAFLSNSTSYAINNSFENQNCTNVLSGCLFDLTSNSMIFLRNTYINSLSNTKAFGAFTFEGSFGVFDKLHIKDIINFKMSKLCISSVDSTIILNDSSFFNYYINALYFESSMVFINSSNFSNSNLLSQQKYIENNAILSPIYVINCNKVHLNFSIISSNFHSTNGGAMTLISYSDPSNVVLSNNSFFINNALENGGALYIININISIYNSNFIQNIAFKGGGVYYSSIKNNNFLFVSNLFLNNQANSEGGAIKWQGSMPYLKNNNFSNNVAVYGNDIATIPLKIRMKISLKNPKFDCDFSKDLSEIYNISNFYCVSSGIALNYLLHFEILDVYSNIVNNLNEKYIKN